MEKYLPTGVISEFIAAFLGIALVVCWRLVNKYLPPPHMKPPDLTQEIAEAKSAGDQVMGTPPTEENKGGV